MDHLPYVLFIKSLFLYSTTATMQNLCLGKTRQHPEQPDLGPEIQQGLPFARFPALPSLKQAHSHTVPGINFIKIMVDL